MITCPACTGENLDDARFCSHCGRGLVGDETGVAAERRLVTVLFADITGSTPLGEELDPEDLQDVLGAYAVAMREEIESEGGTVEKFIGDAVMAVFGVPIAHEDDPSRALRAALRMRRRLDELNDELETRHGVRLAMRTGVNTGDVVASRDARADQGMVTGDAVNAAARLEQTADVGQILVSERTARSAPGFRFGEVGPLTVRGKSLPVATVELLDEGLAELPGGRERGVPGLRAPMVGREHELELLRSTFGRLASSGRAQLVTIYGDPGIGKSRLTRELLAWAGAQGEGVTVLKGRCLPYGEAITYWPLAEVLKTYTGVLDSDPPDAALAKVGALADDVLAGVPDPARSAAVLAFTFGLEDPRFHLADLPPRQVRLETHDAWRAFFTGLTADRPAIVVVEDIHWADDPLLDLLEELADRVAGPLLFVCPARPDLAQRRTGWGGGKRNFGSIFLEPLSHDEAATLVDVLLAVEELGDETREAILARADGNPLFLEEIIRHLIDEGRIVREGSRWRATETIDEIVIPDTVQAVLAARIDLLPTAERSALLSASVVGRVFWTGSVAHLLDEGHETDEVLSRLEDRELVQSQLGSRIAGEREFLFKHVLTRDVAYGTLARRDRARAHADVAAWIELAAGERQREFADLLAHHLGVAYEGAVADPGAPADRREELRRRCLEAALAASAEARSRMLLGKAHAFAESALDVSLDAHERSLALEALGLCALWDYRGDDAWRYLSQAVDERIASGRDRGEVLAMLCARAVEPPTRWPASITEQPAEEDVGRYLDVGLEHADAGGEARIRLLLARSMWPFAFRRGPGFTDDEAEEARRAGEQAVSLAEALGRDDLASAALDGIGSIEFIRGLHGRTLPVIVRRLSIVERLTDPWEIGDALQTSADVALWIGRYRDALRYAEEGYERSRMGPDVWRACLSWRAIAHFKLGAWDAAIDDLAQLEAATATTRFGFAGYFTTSARVCVALLHELRGERGVSDPLVERAQTESIGTSTVRRIPWLARIFAHRGSPEALEMIDETASLAGRAMAEAGILEAQCDAVADLERWDRAEAVVSEARAFAERALLEALPAHADRLEGRAALARGDAAAAGIALSRARDGFARLGARWDEAVASLWLAEARLAEGDADGGRSAAAAAHAVFEDLGSVRELEHARSLAAHP